MAVTTIVGGDGTWKRRRDKVTSRCSSKSTVWRGGKHKYRVSCSAASVCGWKLNAARGGKSFVNTVTKDNLLNKDIKLKTFAIHMHVAIVALNAKQFAGWKRKTMRADAFVSHCSGRGEWMLTRISGCSSCGWRDVDGREAQAEIKNTGTYCKKHVYLTSCI